MAGIKRFFPSPVKRFIKIRRRYLRDLVNGDLKKMGLGITPGPLKHLVKSIEQPITLTATSEAKKKNLSIAAGKLNNVQVLPGQIFSFWHLLGYPSQKKGYQKSRSIIGDQLKEETGGGLCQLSGLIYFLALHGGLTVIERHPHSFDIYREEERFTPLGSDATVVYGYKDLRLMNPYDFPVSFFFLVHEQGLTGQLFSAWPMESNEVEFEYSKQNGSTAVQTRICKDGHSRILTTNLYKKLPGIA